MEHLLNAVFTLHMTNEQHEREKRAHEQRGRTNPRPAPGAPLRREAA
jgi:hypothetical protein